MRSSNNHSTGKRDIPFLVRSLGWEALKKIVASFAMIVTGHTLQLSPPKKILQNSLCLLTLVIVFFSLRSAFSQITDPWKTFNDTIAYAKANHLVAHVNSSLLPAYQYDNDQGSERIKVGHKTYARTPGGIWKISSDWGQTGSPAANTAQLDFFVTVATSPLQQPVSHDPSQGAHVWQPIDSSSPDREVFVLTREHPRPGGAYPTYTFVREGGIFLISAFAGNLSSSSGLSSLRILYDYFLVTSGASVTPQQSSDSGGTTTSQLGDLTLLENNELLSLSGDYEGSMSSSGKEAEMLELHITNRDSPNPNQFNFGGTITLPKGGVHGTLVGTYTPQDLNCFQFISKGPGGNAIFAGVATNNSLDGTWQFVNKEGKTGASGTFHAELKRQNSLPSDPSGQTNS